MLGLEKITISPGLTFLASRFKMLWLGDCRGRSPAGGTCDGAN
jgi:hypothetical protein